MDSTTLSDAQPQRPPTTREHFEALVAYLVSLPDDDFAGRDLDHLDATGPRLLAIDGRE